MVTIIDKDSLNLLLAGGLWLIVVGCAISSVFSQPMDRPTRKFWIIMILCLPPLGLVAYLPFSLDKPKIIKDLFDKLFPGKDA